MNATPREQSKASANAADGSTVNVPLWSIVIPAYNCAELLAPCLASVVGQIADRSDVELIVVDDGSTDHPERVVAEIAGERARMVRHAQPSGAVRSFNNCVALASGQLVHLLHGDDLVKDGFYRALEREFVDPSVLIAACRTELIDDQGERLSVTRSQVPGGGRWPNALREMTVSNRMPTPAVVVRASAYHQVGLFREDLPHSADWEMWCRVAAAGQTAFVDEVLAEYRIHDGSDTAARQRSGATIAERLTTMRIVQEYLPAELRRAAARDGLLYSSVFAVRLAAASAKRRDFSAAATQARAGARCLGWAITRRGLPDQARIESLIRDSPKTLG